MATDLQPCLACRACAARMRGLCDRCYRRAAKAVAAGETTWAALEAVGQALPPKPRGAAWRKWFGPGKG